MHERHLLAPTCLGANKVETEQHSKSLYLVFTNEEHIVSDMNYLPGLGSSDHLQMNFVLIVLLMYQKVLLINSIFQRRLQKYESGLVRHPVVLTDWRFILI